MIPLLGLLRRLLTPRTDAPPPLARTAGSAHGHDCVARAQLDAVADATNVGLVLCGAEGELVLVNAEAALLLAVPEVRGPGAHSWPDGTEAVRDVLAQALASDDASLEASTLDALGGRTMSGQARRTAAADNEPSGALLVLRAADEPRRQQVGESGALDEFRQLSGTSLNAMSSFSSLLLEEVVGSLNPVQRDFLRAIEQEIGRVSQSIESLFDGVSTDADSSGPTAVARALGPLVEQCLTNLLPLTAERGVSVEVDVPVELPSVAIDVEQVGFVLRHLLDTAVSRAEADSHVLIRARAGVESVSVTVAEQRPVAPRVGGSPAPRLASRSPLGLVETSALVGPGFEDCARIVSRHGGRLWVEESSDQGERVTFTLPLSGSAAPASGG